MLSHTIPLAFMSAFVAVGCKSSNRFNENHVKTSSAPQGASSDIEGRLRTTHVAVIGDSQSTGAYGQRLAELIRFASHQRLSFFGAASSGRIGSWVYGGFSPIPAGAYFGCESYKSENSCTPASHPGKKTTAISSILKNHPQVKLFIITLGDNHFYDPSSVRVEIPKLINPVLSSGAQCAFVTPTEGLGQFSNKLNLIRNIIDSLNDVKSSTGKTCALIDSYTVGKDVLKDDADLQLLRQSVSADPMKLHPRGAGAKLWAERVFKALVDRKLLTPL